MLKDFLELNNIKSQANFVAYGYGQVEPNHLSAQRTGQIYAQLPASKEITLLEQGQFVKYDYAKGMVNFDGPGEWMLVYNETKLYREHQNDCEFAMKADDYQARIYSPFGYGLDKEGRPMSDVQFDRQSRYYNGKDSGDEASITMNQYFKVPSGSTSIEIAGRSYPVATDGKVTYNKTEYDVVSGVSIPVVYAYDDVTAGADPYELHYNEDPMHIAGPYKEQRMAADVNSMVPRVFKTNVGDIFTTNTVIIAGSAPVVGDFLTPGEKGILTPAVGSEDMLWQIVKIYTLPDHQPAYKLMRIK